MSNLFNCEFVLEPQTQDRRAKSEYSFGKLLNSAHVLSVKRFGMEVKMTMIHGDRSCTPLQDIRS